jgi:hypothetical protein
LLSVEKIQKFNNNDACKLLYLRIYFLGRAIAKNKIKISSEAKVIKVKEKILMKIDVNSTTGHMGIFLAEYGIFLNNKRTLKSYDLKNEVNTRILSP